MKLEEYLEGLFSRLNDIPSGQIADRLGMFLVNLGNEYELEPDELVSLLSFKIAAIIEVEYEEKEEWMEADFARRMAVQQVMASTT